MAHTVTVTVTVAFTLFALSACLDPDDPDPGDLETTSQDVTLATIESAIGADLKWSGAEATLAVTQPAAGVFEVIAPAFACAPTTPGCEPDRYELVFPRRIEAIYGLGTQTSSNRVDVDLVPAGTGVEQLLDTAFSSGHTPRLYNSDINRLRTPMLVFPKEGLIVAYLQRALKMVRVTRTATTTTIVFKKDNLAEGTPARLLVVKRAAPAAAYTAYKASLARLGFFFKRPHPAAFGVITETVNELSMIMPTVGGATPLGLDTALDLYATNRIHPSVLVFGSGFWRTNPTEVCMQPPFDFGGLYRLPTIETLTVRDPAIKTFFANTCARRGTYPAIGMRQHGSRNSGNALVAPTTGMSYLADRLHQANPAITGDPFLPGVHFSRNELGTPARARLLDLRRPGVAATYFSLIRKAYGPVMGFKEDEMLLGDSRHLAPTDPSLVNLPDGMVAPAYRAYTEATHGDFVLIGRNDWFSVGTNLQNGQGWVDLPPADSDDSFKFALDSALTQVASGYPHPKLEEHAPAPLRSLCTGFSCDTACGSALSEADRIARYNACCVVDKRTQEEAIVREAALHTFAAAGATSHGFWHLAPPVPPQPDLRARFVFFLQLRGRLQQYAYDQAQEWYRDGVPRLMRPLFIDFPADPNVNALYGRHTDPAQPHDEYMFGNALLVRPTFNGTSNPLVYLPKGRWRPFLHAGPIERGPATTRYLLSGSAPDYPVYLKDGEILLIVHHSDPSILQAYVFLDEHAISQRYVATSADGTLSTLEAERRSDGSMVFRNVGTGRTVTAQPDAFGKGFMVAPVNAILGPMVRPVCTPPATP